MAKRAKGDGSIRQRKDGKWEARYTVGRDPGTGKQIRKSIYADSQSEARKLLNQIINDIDKGIFVEPSKIKVGEWLDIWLDECVKGKVKPLTYASYETQCRIHIKPALGATLLTKLKSLEIQKFINDLERGTDKRNKSLSAKTIKNIHGVLNEALKQALKLDYIPKNISHSGKDGVIKLPDLEKKEIKPLDDSQIAAFMKAVQGHKFEIIYLFSIFTGMRQSEVLAMSWGCLKDGIITVSRQLLKEKKKGGKYYLATLKNNKTRRLQASNYVLELLKRQEHEQLKQIVNAGKLWSNENKLVFTNELGDNLAHVTVYRHFKKLAAGLGIPEARFHDLRHSYAVAALSSGDDVKTLQENLGHHSAGFTLDTYGYVTEKMKKESAERMDNFIKSVQSLA